MTQNAEEFRVTAQRPKRPLHAVLKRAVLKIPKYGCQEDAATLFSLVPTDRTRSDGHKLKGKKLDSNMRMNFTLRVAGHWNRLPGEVMSSPSLETFQNNGDAFLDNLLQVMLQGGGTGWSPKVPSNPTDSVK